MRGLESLPKFAFIDTEVYRKNLFDFNNKDFGKLEELVAANKITLLQTTVTIEEVRNQIKKLLNESITGIKAFKKKNSILNKSKLEEIANFWSFSDFSQIQTSIFSQFDEFMRKNKVITVDIKSVSVDDIFSKYFDTKPPFQSGDKKSEFPDAFAIAALENYSSDIHEKIIIVSGDSDWKMACSNNKNFLFFN